MLIELVCVGHDGTDWTIKPIVWRNDYNGQFADCLNYYPTDFVYLGY